MKYFRSYPWWLQLFLFLMMIFTMSIFGAGMLVMLLPKFTTYTFSQLEGVSGQSPMSLITAAIIEQGILSIFTFFIPAWLFSYLTDPQPSEYLGLRAPGKKLQWVLVILIIIGAIPILELMEGLISQIDFGAKVRASQADSDRMMGAFLTMPTFSSFIKSFVVMAIIPAFGEEMLFRGVFLRLVKKRSRTMATPVFFTAVVFALAHSNIYGFLSIFIAGILLAVIYNLTGSLWCSILGHLVFNGAQIVLAYAGNGNPAVHAFIENNAVPYYLAIGGAIVFSLSFYLLLKNKTPLPDNWTDDSPPAGPKEGDWDFMAKS